MKRNKFISLLPAALFAAAGLDAVEIGKGRKMLTVYYSWSGNTRHIADLVKKFTSSDILEIVPTEAYPSSYNRTVAIAKKEVDAQYRRPIKTEISNLADYDVIFVGSPNWWGTISSPIRTFLSKNDFSGKTIVPFITHEGSRFGNALADIGKICPKSKIADGLEVRGGSVRRADKTVEAWLRKLGVIYGKQEASQC